MKKIYVAPAIEVMNINTVPLCTSIDRIETSTGDAIDLGQARSREHSLWDPFEEDED